MPTVPDIFDAIASSDLDQLKQLVGNDPTLAASRNEAGVSALMTAAYHQNADMVKLLRDTNPELDIFEAASLGDVARVRTLQGDPKSATSQSSDGFTPLHFAAFFDKPEVAKLLIDSGADVNAVAANDSCVQPLHSAAASRAIEVVRVLLDSGADPNAGQQGGWTALQSASKQGDEQAVEVLLQHGGNPNQQAENGESAVTTACNDRIREMLTKPNSK